MSYHDFLLKFVIDYDSTLRPLFKRVFDNGVTISLAKGKKRVPINDMLQNIRRKRTEAKAILDEYCMENDGVLFVEFFKSDIFRLQYDRNGKNFIHMVFMQGKPKEFYGSLGKEIEELRKTFKENFSSEDADDLIDMAADFLATCEGYSFMYELIADDKPFIRGELSGLDFDLQLLDPLVYLKTLLFTVRGAEFKSVPLKSPKDILSLLEGLQGGLKGLANAFNMYGLQLTVGAMDQIILSAGRDVKPNLTNMFGPTSIKLDSAFKIFSALLSKIKI